MNESVFREILEESFRREYAEFDSVPEHRFSLRHRLAMGRVFARFEKNRRELSEVEVYQLDPRYSLKRRLIVALVVVILMTLLTGWFIPIRGVLAEQIDWLKSRYDFPSMKVRVSQMNENDARQPTAGIILVDVCRTTDEYLNFLDDLEYLGIYSAEETQEIRRQTKPVYTGSPNINSSVKIESYNGAVTFHGEIAPLDETREHVEYLEKMIAYYAERAKDPERAIEGDAEFAEMMSEQYLSLHRRFLELLEKLYADVPGGESGSEKQNNASYNLDKEDKIKLFKFNKV